MADFEITEVHDVGNDVLRVTASVDEETVEVFGWVSATRNHYDESAYGTDGHLVDGSEPRTMTAEEVGAYARTLVADSLAAEPVAPITFK